jgi:transposase
LEGILRRWQLCFGEKGGRAVGKTKRGKGTKWMAVVDGHGLPLGITIHSASPAEVKLVDNVIESIPGKTLPERMIGDKAYDSTPLALDLAERYGIKLIAPHRRNRKVKTQDGRGLRRYRRRWKVERFFAWLNNFRRLPTRWEYHSENYLGFLELACCIIMFRYL